MNFLGGVKRIKRGLYHYRVTDDYEGLRLHLRVEDDESSVLIINSSRVLFLNNTATFFIHRFMQGKTENEISEEVLKRFKVEEETVFNDYKDILFVVNTIAKTKDICPVSYLGVEKIEPFQKEITAPYRMDLAITYKCNNECFHCYAGSPKETNELNTEEWFNVINSLFEIGVPHIVFTGGEPTLRSDLDKLIRFSENKGLVTGLVTNGRKLADNNYLKSLIDAGLDHIQITLHSHDENIHDEISCVEGSWRETIQGIKNAVATPVYTLTNTTLNSYNIDGFLETIRLLNNLGLEQFACNSIIYSGNAVELPEIFALKEDELQSILDRIREYAELLGMEFIWYTPTQYCICNPLQLELGIKSCSACRFAMAIEPNGDVLPCQSYFHQLGNILKDNWNSIWNHSLCKEIRDRKYVSEKCLKCTQLTTCGGGCPLSILHREKQNIHS